MTQVTLDVGTISFTPKLNIVAFVKLLSFSSSFPPSSSQLRGFRGANRQKLDSGVHQCLGYEHNILLGVCSKSANAQRQSRATPVA